MKKQVKAVFSILIAAVTVLSSCLIFTADKGDSLSNKKADERTVKIYEYLKETEKNGVLSAQQESTWMGSDDYELNYIYSASGKYPAIRGFDYMNDDFKGVNKRALEWWNRGGLVTICWHTGSNFSGEWNDAKNDDISDWDKALTQGTPEYDALIKGMDKGAEALSQLQEKGVTVLWRPFHEFDGDWFWWSRGGAENFKKLWKLMYARYTDYWKLNNLIWVLGYSHKAEKIEKWYVGNEFCDIIGTDSYEKGAHPELYKTLKKLYTKKPLCLHECGENPTAKELSKTKWLWFMTWHTEYLTDNNTPEMLKELYNSESVITLDKLPDFKE